MSERLMGLLAEARARFPEVAEPTEAFGEISVEVPRELLIDVATWLRDEAGFSQLADWSAIDYLDIEPPARRFLLSAHLSSPEHADRLRVRVYLPDGDERCPSLTAVWTGAYAQEREMYDFFGVAFEGHPDLRRIFMPEEWEGHPQRKDYPLGGVNVEYHHGAFIPPPDTRGQKATTTGYPGRLS